MWCCTVRKHSHFVRSMLMIGNYAVSKQSPVVVRPLPPVTTRRTPLRQRWSTTTSTAAAAAATAAADAPAVLLLLRREADAFARASIGSSQCCRRHRANGRSNGCWRVTYETGSLPASEPLLEEHRLAARAHMQDAYSWGVGCCCACAEVAHSVVPCMMLLC
jgi:hypothetical protein